jgi:hypothetical protein
MLIFKRDPQAVAVAVCAVLVVLGRVLNVDPVVIGGLAAIVTALAYVVQYLNVVDDARFVTACAGLASALLTFAAGYTDVLDSETQSLAVAAVPLILGLLTRNGVTNRHTAAGRQIAVF